MLGLKLDRDDSSLERSLVQRIEHLRQELDVVNRNAALAAERIALARQSNEARELIVAEQCQGALLAQASVLERQIADLEGQRADLKIRKCTFLSSYQSIKSLSALIEEFTSLEIDPPVQPTADQPSEDDWQLPDFPDQPFRGDGSGFDVRTWRISGETTLELIEKKLCNGNRQVALDLVNKCEEAVIKLRAMFAWLRDTGMSFNKKDHFQPVFILLLKYIIGEIESNLPTRQNMQVCPANRITLKGTLPPECDQCAKRILRGKSDVAVFCGPNVESILSWLFRVEMKLPFANTPLYLAKHRLVGQSEAIAQMRNDGMPVLGCLTDLNEIIVSLRLPALSSEMSDRVVFNTECVRDPRGYTLLLLFLFCDLSPGELIAVTVESSGADADFEDAKDDTDTSVQGQLSKSELHKRSRDGSIYIYLNDDSDEEEQEQYRGLNIWDARRRGVIYYCQEDFDELQRELRARSNRSGRSDYQQPPWRKRA